MKWVFRAFSTSVGKKQLMAVTGVMFLLFLAVHLAGNLTIHVGAESFNSYSEHLHDLGPFLAAAELLLVLFALLHIGTGAVLFFQNRRARPVRYAVDKSGGGGRTIFSRTMPYTGLLILFFLLVHLATVSRFWVDKAQKTNFQMVTELFSKPGYVVFYLISMVIIAFHVRHGLWSAFQSVGANHPKYMPCIEKLSTAYAVIIGVGFASLPIAVWLMT